MRAPQNTLGRSILPTDMEFSIGKTIKITKAKKSYLLKIVIIGAVLLILLIILSVFFSISNQADYVNSPPTDQQILAQLKKIIFLPDDIAPSMAIVMDDQTLKKQQPEFFANVKNGDRLIIYPDLAIIYDYNANKIIKIGPVQNVSSQSK